VQISANRAPAATNPLGDLPMPPFEDEQCAGQVGELPDWWQGLERMKREAPSEAQGSAPLGWTMMAFVSGNRSNRPLRWRGR